MSVAAIVAFHIARAAPAIVTAMIPVSVPVTVALAAIIVIVIVIKSADNERASANGKARADRVDVALRISTRYGQTKRCCNHGGSE